MKLIITLTCVLLISCSSKITLEHIGVYCNDTIDCNSYKAFLIFKVINKSKSSKYFYVKNQFKTENLGEIIILNDCDTLNVSSFTSAKKINANDTLTLVTEALLKDSFLKYNECVNIFSNSKYYYIPYKLGEKVLFDKPVKIKTPKKLQLTFSIEGQIIKQIILDK